MDFPKSSNQWKFFDFGPPMKEKSNASNETIEKTNESKISGRIKNKSVPFTPRVEPFNFFDKLKPNTINDLAVHPKKIQEVEQWIKINAFQTHKNNAPFLLISGPTGSGKTSTVIVVCKALNISISEWINPVDQEFEYKGMNQVTQFMEFLSESKYNTLFENSNHRITLVKDFPNAIIQNPQQFFEVLEACKYTTKQPIIFICTDASSSHLNLQRTLFPDDILQKFNVTHISFNICAPTLIKAALQRAQEVIKVDSDKFKQPSSETIEAIMVSAAGDIRNAMNQYHIASLIGAGNIPLMSTEPEKKTAKRKRTINTKTSLMSKDQHLGLFHGLGRVLNPKRKIVGNSWRLTYNIESLIDEFSTQPQMFTSFLFENYLKYFGDIMDVAKSAEVLSLSVRFLENWERHETLMFGLWISVLGLMIFNEHHISRWNQIKGPNKITKMNLQNNMEFVGLNATDYHYYNIITKSNKFHTFVINF